MRKNTLRALRLKTQIDKMQRTLDDLKPKATIDLYKHGYSMDEIVILLRMGKITVLKILHLNKVKIKRTKYKKRGRKPIVKKV